MKKMTQMSAFRDFFGMKPGQTALQFGQEYKALSEADRKEIAAELTAKHGYEITNVTTGANVGMVAA